jgi:hypothetical protein
MQGGVVFKVGEPIETHAAKVYTRTMFEKFRVVVSEGYYTCECGMYEHMGMLCCHVVKVIYCAPPLAVRFLVFLVLATGQ